MRRAFSKVLTAVFSLISVFAGAHPNAWNGFKESSVVSSLDGYVNKFYFYATTSIEKQPLVISLHQWSANYAYFGNSLAPEAKQKNWNYIHPDFRGPNDHSKACGSDFVISDIDDVIDWAVKNMPVDESRIYIIGASGGGYTALCHFMKTRTTHQINEYSVWVPITDLERWYYESIARKTRYASDILRSVCAESASLPRDKARERSPLFMKTPDRKLDSTKITIYAGIHDGCTGAVPITHSILFYNKIVSDAGGDGAAKVGSNEISWMLTTRTGIEGTGRSLGGRLLHYYRSYKNVSLAVFEGGHEILEDVALEALD